MPAHSLCVKLMPLLFAFGMVNKTRMGANIFVSMTLRSLASYPVLSVAYRLLTLQIYLAISYYFHSALVKCSLGHDLITAEVGEDLCPKCPIYGSQEENSNSDNWEYKVGISVWIRSTLGGYKRYDSKESIRQKIDDRDRQERMPRRRPVFRLLELEVYKASSDKGVDPRSRICVPV